METEDYKNLADVATNTPSLGVELPLESVGMENIQALVKVGELHLPASVNVAVSLVSNKRGIHMSRLFRKVSELSSEPISWPWLTQVLDEMLDSQKGLSSKGEVSVSFAWPVQRSALLSDSKGWRNYPVTYTLQKNETGYTAKLKLEVLYSSTCPCSAALSRQALSADFERAFQSESAPKSDYISKQDALKWFEEQSGEVAWPHAQRSQAKVELLLNPSNEGRGAIEWIDLVEKSLGTPVQTAVKREDEQEFARLNAQNQMFCEDAARKLGVNLMNQPIEGFNLEVRHFESLHPHDVVARLTHKKST